MHERVNFFAWVISRSNSKNVSNLEIDMLYYYQVKKHYHEVIT